MTEATLHLEPEAVIRMRVKNVELWELKEFSFTFTVKLAANMEEPKTAVHGSVSCPRTLQHAVARRCQGPTFW